MRYSLVSLSLFTIFLLSSVASAGDGVGLDAFLDKNGGLDLEALRASGYEGPVEIEGRELVIDPETSRPTLQASADKTLSDEPWAEGFHLPGFNNSVYAVCVFEGGLYVGGVFDTYGSVPAKNMAYYDGERWWGFEERFGFAVGYVYSMVVHNDLLVIGCTITLAGPTGNSYNIVGFDGEQLHLYGSGLVSAPYVLLNFDGTLVAGGHFYYDGSGAITLKNIARWSGSAWEPYGTGLNGEAKALCEFGGNLVVGGLFSMADDVGVNGIARWTGDTFEPFRTHTQAAFGGVEALLSHGGFLYAGGKFDTIEGKRAANLARWDGDAWSQVGSGITSDSDYCYVKCLEELDGDVFVGGSFQQAGNVSTTGAVIWNGTQYVEMAGGVIGSSDGGVKDIVEYGGDWWLGGWFQRAGDLITNRIVLWDGVGWSIAPGTEGAGLNGVAYALCIWNGDLIAGGNFTAAGTTLVDRIARWDGITWYDMGGGLDDTVQALTVWNGDLIAAGDFLYAGTIPRRHIARWDGAGWHDLGGGINETAEVLAVYQDHLYVGGLLTKAGRVPVANLARWDGVDWSDPGGGVDDRVRALLAIDDELLVGGDFLNAGATPASHLASWDGMSWSEFGAGADGDVYALAYYGGVVAGGDFLNLGSTPCSRIGRWDGASWDQLGQGFWPEECRVVWPDELDCWNVYVTDMAVSEGRLFVSGITGTDHMPLLSLACWTDTEHWTPLGSGIPSVWTICGDEQKLWVGGSFMTLSGAPADRVISWDIERIPVDGDERWWSGFGEFGTNSRVYSLGQFDGELVAGGWFTEAGGVEVGRVASWDGSSWSALGEGFGRYGLNSPSVRTLLEWNGVLYASGIFSLPPATDNVSFARWNGSSWEPLMDALFPEKVVDLVPYGDDLLLIGSFTEVEGEPAGGLALYDGTEFTVIPVSVTGDEWGAYMSGGVIYEGNLVVYGDFLAIDGIPCGSIARWDGVSWLLNDDGFGVTGNIRDALVVDGDLYIGGRFSEAGSVPVSGIAKWDGLAWDDLGGGLALASGSTPEIQTMTMSEGSIVAAGSFDMASGAPCSDRIAAWDGTAWNSMGSGLALSYMQYVNDLAVWDSDLYLAGGFSVAGDKLSKNIARWLVDPAASVTTLPHATTAVLHAPYPNPFNGCVAMRFELSRRAHVTLAVHDVRGRLVRTLIDTPLSADTHEVKWDGCDHRGAELPSGVYLVRLRAGETTMTGKLVYLR